MLCHLRRGENRVTMIQANELRIGNLVLFKGEVDVIIEIGQAGNGFCENNGYFNFDTGTIAPIPLTPEWLERCGFEYKEPNYTKMPLSIGKNFFRDGTGNYDGFVLRHKFEYCIQVLVIKDLHQLQNLYFALTGEELKIELL
jgi:hypothetical protein